jgi:general secretion pathway protein G
MFFERKLAGKLPFHTFVDTSPGWKTMTQRRADIIRGQSGRKRSMLASAGFTLLELMIVVTILLILMSIAIPRLEQSRVYAKEAALKQDLFTMRQAIQNYTLDKEAAPQSLDDLVQSGYLGAIPVDPMTNTKDWTTDSSDLLMDPDQQTAGGISDVHSASNDVSPFDGTPYSTW